MGEKWNLKTGVRLVNWSNQGPTTYYDFNDNFAVTDTIQADTGVYHTYVRLDPRFSLHYQIDNNASLHFSTGIYHQYLQLISNSISPFTSMEVWLPSSPNIRPQSAFQTALSYAKRSRDRRFAFDVTAYYKSFNHQIEYKNHAQTLINPILEGELRFGTMQSYGAEFSIRKELGRVNGRIGYTYSKTTRKTPDLNNGASYPAFQDRPHEVSVLLNAQLSKRLFLSTYWTYFSGATFSSPTGFYTFQNQQIPIYDQKNNSRLSNYQRFDFALKYNLHKDETKRYKHSLIFSIYNAGAHKNNVAIHFNKIPVDDGRPVIPTDLLNGEAISPTALDLIRFFPSLTYKFKL